MIVVTMTPLVRSAETGGTRAFKVRGVDFNMSAGTMILRCRDGELCTQPIGAWRVTMEERFSVGLHTVAEAEAIHNETALITTH